MCKKQQFKVLVSPTGSMNMLSQLEIRDLKKRVANYINYIEIAHLQY